MWKWIAKMWRAACEAEAERQRQMRGGVRPNKPKSRPPVRKPRPVA